MSRHAPSSTVSDSDCLACRARHAWLAGLPAKTYVGLGLIKMTSPSLRTWLVSNKAQKKRPLGPPLRWGCCMGELSLHIHLRARADPAMSWYAPGRIQHAAVAVTSAGLKWVLAVVVIAICPYSWRREGNSGVR